MSLDVCVPKCDVSHALLLLNIFPTTHFASYLAGVAFQGKEAGTHQLWAGSLIYII